MSGFSLFLLIAGVLVSLLMVAFAFTGPSVPAAGQAARGSARASQPFVGGRRPGAAQAHLRQPPGQRARRPRPAADPQPRRASQAARPDRPVVDAGSICDGVGRTVRDAHHVADVQGAAGSARGSGRLGVGLGLPHFGDQQADPAPGQPVHARFPGRDRADGARPALGPSDLRDSAASSPTKSTSRSRPSSAPSPTR